MLHQLATLKVLKNYFVLHSEYGGHAPLCQIKLTQINYRNFSKDLILISAR